MVPIFNMKKLQFRKTNDLNQVIAGAEHFLKCHPRRCDC